MSDHAADNPNDSSDSERLAQALEKAVKGADSELLKAVIAEWRERRGRRAKRSSF